MIDLDNLQYCHCGSPLIKKESTKIINCPYSGAHHFRFSLLSIYISNDHFYFRAMMSLKNFTYTGGLYKSNKELCGKELGNERIAYLTFPKTFNFLVIEDCKINANKTFNKILNLSLLS